MHTTPTARNATLPAHTPGGSRGVVAVVAVAVAVAVVLVSPSIRSVLVRFIYIVRIRSAAFIASTKDRRGGVCIVVIDADFSGRGYDLRTTEKNIQLYHQLSGRAGRFSSDSLIIYQTLSPKDVTLNELIKNNSEQLLKNELTLREKNLLPPFS